MSDKNFEFINIKRSEPNTKPLEIRKIKFDEIYEKQSLNRQKSNQVDAYIVQLYCEWKCPLHNYIPNWLKLVEEGEIIQAAELCHETTLFRNMWKDLPTRKAMRGRMYAKHWIRSSNNRSGRKIHLGYCFRKWLKPQKLTNKNLFSHLDNRQDPQD